MFYLIIILLIAYIIYSKLTLKRNEDKLQVSNDTILPYKKKEYLFTNAEKSFYGVLKLILRDDNFSIFAKVRLADLLYLPNNTPNRQIYWNKIQSKHVDFIICDDNHVKPVLAIELDDSSHNKVERIDRDTFINKSLHDAGLNIIRVKASNAYNVNEISQLIYSYIKPNNTINEHITHSENEDNNISIDNNSIVDIPTCPKCGVAMIERTAKKGDNAGKKFYGCPNFPKCKEVKEI